MDDDILKISGKELKKHFVRARLEKVCNCKSQAILIDVENRVLECSECGAILDPFEVCKKILRYESSFWQEIKWLKEEKEELEKWMLNNRMGKTLRQVASNIRAGNIPCCPHCDEPFELENIKSWCSKQYAINRVTKKMFEFKED